MTTTATANSNGSNANPSKLSGAPRPPVVLWAQRADSILLTIEIEDCKEPQLKLEKEKLYFRGKSDSIRSDADHQEHEVTIEFHKPIKPDDSKHNVGARGIEFVIVKEEPDWWPRLLKDTTKRHWLKVDFPKWKDEDDSDDELMGPGGPGGAFGGGGQPDFSDLMQQFKGIGGDGAMGGLGGEGDEEFESDDDEDAEQSLPDLEN